MAKPSINKIFIVGDITSEPVFLPHEVGPEYGQDGLYTFKVTSLREFKAKNGEPKTESITFDCGVWGISGCALKLGDSISLEGFLRMEVETTPEGKKIYSHRIIITSLAADHESK
jgi:single-stranded DNA-binding protein